MSLPRFCEKGVVMEKVWSLTQRQILLRMAGKRLQTERIAAADRQATIRMNIVG